jgi:hypothetical protein
MSGTGWPKDKEKRMSLTPMSHHSAGECCSLCAKRLGVDNCAIVYQGDSNTITIGDCCVGNFMSSTIQDYDQLLRRRYPVEHLIYWCSGDRVKEACMSIGQRCAEWREIMQSIWAARKQPIPIKVSNKQ